MQVKNRIKRETTIVNGVKDTKFNGFNTLAEALLEKFTDQGDFYVRALGVKREDAEIAGWHPNDKDFKESCQGWATMLVARGRIKKTIITEYVSYREALGFKD